MHKKPQSAHLTIHMMYILSCRIFHETQLISISQMTDRFSFLSRNFFTFAKDYFTFKLKLKQLAYIHVNVDFEGYFLVWLYMYTNFIYSFSIHNSLQILAHLQMWLA